MYWDSWIHEAKVIQNVKSYWMWQRFYCLWILGFGKCTWFDNRTPYLPLYTYTHTHTYLPTSNTHTTWKRTITTHKHISYILTLNKKTFIAELGSILLIDLFDCWLDYWLLWINERRFGNATSGSVLLISVSVFSAFQVSTTENKCLTYPLRIGCLCEDAVRLSVTILSVLEQV